MLGVIFDLQHQEDEEVRLDKLAVEVDTSGLDRNVLGHDPDVGRQIKQATKMARYAQIRFRVCGVRVILFNLQTQEKIQVRIRSGKSEILTSLWILNGHKS